MLPSLATDRKKIIFILGHGRSGTTLLNRVLSAHPQIGFICDDFSHFCWFYENHQTYDCYGPDKYWRMAVDFSRHHKIKRNKAPINKDKFHYITNFHDWFVVLLDTYCPDKPIAGIKIAHLLKQNVAMIKAMFPDSSCLHIIRDPRDVYLSVKKTPFGTVSPFYGGKSWSEGVALLQSLQCQVKNYLEIKYEDLITLPEKELRKICAWLGLEYNERMLKFYEFANETHEPSHKLLNYDFAKDNFNKWRREMNGADLSLLYAGCGKMIEKYGYHKIERVETINFFTRLKEYLSDRIIVSCKLLLFGSSEKYVNWWYEFGNQWNCRKQRVKNLVDLFKEKKLMTEPLISVVIPVYNGAKTIDDCLRSVLSQGYNNIEVIVVDNNSTDNTKCAVQKYFSDRRVKCIFEPRKGRGAARNSGIQSAQGGIICMLDADCIAPADWVSRLIKPIIEGNESIVLGFIENAVDNFWTTCARQADLDFFRQNQDVDYIEHFAGANFAAKSEVLKKTAFDPRISNLEDYDFYLRLKKNARIRFLPEVTVKHHHQETLKEVMLKNFDRGYWLAKIYRKNRALIDKKNEPMLVSLSLMNFLTWPFWLAGQLLLKGPRYFLYLLPSDTSWRLGLIWGLISKNNIVNERYISFTFDDGLISSAKKVDEILNPHKATFYLVTGWVKPNQTPIVDSYNIGLDHGTINDWTNLSSRGHDIGSHGVSHARPKQASDESEYCDSLEFIKKLREPPYSFASPYNEIIATRAPYDSIRQGTSKKIFNRLNKINFYRIIAWDPIESGLDEEQMLKKIKEVPADSWLILRLHGMDDEGYCPCSRQFLKRLRDGALENGYKIKTVAAMTEMFKEK